MRRRKILFLITKATWGGAQKYVYDLAINLPEEFRPVVALGGNGLLKQKLDAQKIPTVRIWGMQRDVSLLKESFAFIHLIYSFLWKIRPDIVHLNSSKAAALGALAARITFRKRVIFTVHGWPFKERRSALIRTAIYFVSWLTSALSHAVIVVSKSDEMQGKRMWLVGKKVHYVPIGIETPEFLSGEKASTSLALPANGRRYIVTIAELTANKGIRYAIEAMAELKKRGVDVSYFLIGEGEERERLQALARELDVSDRIFFKGFLAEASKYLAAFDIFILPSIKEGMPYVLLEAAAAGLTIVATDVVEAEASKIPNIYFTRPADGKALADAVEKLARNLPAGKSSMAGSFADMLKKTLQLYKS